jgi:hypothetical protein
MRRVTLRQKQETEPTGKQDGGPVKKQPPALFLDSSPSCETDEGANRRLTPGIEQLSSITLRV